MKDEVKGRRGIEGVSQINTERVEFQRRERESQGQRRGKEDSQ